MRNIVVNENNKNIEIVSENGIITVDGEWLEGVNITAVDSDITLQILDSTLINPNIQIDCCNVNLIVRDSNLESNSNENGFIISNSLVNKGFCHRSKLNNTNLDNSTIKNYQFKDVKFSSSFIQSLLVSESEIMGVDFYHCYIYGTSFDCCYLRNVVFEYGNYNYQEGIELFNSCELANIDFKHILLPKNVIEGSNDVNLSNIFKGTVYFYDTGYKPQMIKNYKNKLNFKIQEL